MSRPRLATLLIVLLPLSLLSGALLWAAAPPWELSIQAAKRAGDRLDFDEEERLLRKALAEAEQGGATALRRAEILDELGMNAFYQGRKEEAERTLSRALELKRQALGPDHPAAAVTLRLLSNLLFAEGRHVRSEELLLDALGIQNRALAPADPERIQTLILLGALYQGLHRYEDAERYYLDAVRQQGTGKDPAQMQAALGMLIDLYQETGKPEKRREIQDLYDRYKSGKPVAAPKPPSPGRL